MRTTTLSRIGAIACALGLAAAAPAGAQSLGAEKQLFWQNATISKNPNLHVSGNNVYVAWSTFAGNCSDIYVATSTNNGDSFGAPVKVTSCTAGTENLHPVVVGNGSSVHVFWTDNVTGESPTGGNLGIGRIFHARSVNNGGSFTILNTSLVSAPGYSRPTGAVMRGTEVHLVFYDNRVVTNASIAGRVYHKLSCNDGTNWGSDLEVTQFDGDVDSEHPRLALTTDNRIFMIFRSSRGGIPFPGHTPFQVYVQRLNSTNCPTHTANWSYPAMRLSRGSNVELGGNYGPNIFPGRNGRLVAGWWNDTAGTNLLLRHGDPNGSGFGPQVDVSEFGLNHPQWGYASGASAPSDAAELTGFGMGEDTTNRLHVAYLQRNAVRNPYEVGPLWHRCNTGLGTSFVGNRLVNGLAAQPRAMMGNGRFHMVWMDFRNTGSNQAGIYYNYVTTGACSEPPAGSAPVPSTLSLAFGGNSVGTTKPLDMTLSNAGGGAITVSSIAASAGFSVVGHNCGSIAPASNCTITVGFKPTAAGAANGTLTITWSAGGPPSNLQVSLSGTGELSLVKHYYRAILNRDPEPGGQEFWEAEKTRLTGLGANINEVWFVMANYFFNSPEYINSNKSNAQFVTDLYNTFFNRPPDSIGFDYWMGQLNSGLSREGVLFWFMFSNEFKTFTQGIFGNTAARPEVDMVMDLFRGILNRFPDTPAFNAFVGSLRNAQCQGPGQVYQAVNDISYFFIFGSGEYANRNRSNTQYVSDMYNAFLRRGGNVSEVNFWINQLNTSGMSRNTVRSNFINSGEFGARVNAVINAGCLP